MPGDGRCLLAIVCFCISSFFPLTCSAVESEARDFQMPRLLKRRFNQACRRAGAALLALLLAPLPPITFDARAADGLPLEPRKTVEREIGGAAEHRYQIALEPGQCARLVIDQSGIDVVEEVFGPDGKKIVEASLPDKTQGAEPLYIVAGPGGAHTIVVRTDNKEAPAGRYRITLEEVRRAGARDRDLAVAQGLFNEAVALDRQQSAESRRAAIEKCSEALARWRAAGEREREADALSYLGLIHYHLSDNQKALDHLGRALVLRREVKDASGEALTLNNIGMAHWAVGDKRKALDYYNQALTLNRSLAEAEREAVLMNNIAACLADLGENHKALDYYNQAVVKHRALGSRKEEAITLSNIGYVYDQIGERQKALDYYSRALAAHRAGNDRDAVAITLLNIAKVRDDLGERQKALDHLAEALPLFRAVGNRRMETLTLNNTGHVYWLLGDYQKALSYYNEALPISRATGDRSNEGLLLNNIGKLFDDWGERQKALSYYDRALAIWRSIEIPRMQAITLGNIGKIHQAMGERQKALDYYSQALALNRAVSSPDGEAIILHNIGTTRASLGDRARALDDLNQALAISRDIKEPRVEAQTLFRIALVERDEGKLAEALARMGQALPIIESLRADVKNPQLRAAYFASVRSYYDAQIDLLMRMHERNPSGGHDGLALQTSERARARSLLEILVESRAEIRQGVEAGLLERERALQELINTKAALQTRLLSRRATDRAAAVSAEISALAAERQQVDAAIRQKSPRYAALTRPAPLTLREIQQQVLDPDTLLLEYALGDERSYLWAVTDSSMSGYELPARPVVEAAARRVHKLITAQNEQVTGESIEQRQARLARAEEEFGQAAQELSRIVLSPVAEKLANRRLVIVAEGALQYVPFAALPAPEAQGSGAGGQGSGKKEFEISNLKVQTRHALTPSYRLLIQDHEVVVLPSASTLAVLRREIEKRPPAPKMIAVIADPVFDKDDPRVSAAGGNRQNRSVIDNSVTDNAGRAAVEAGQSDTDLRIARLPLTREEARAVAGLVPASERKEALDFEASRAMVTSGELAKYRYVHFATHGMLNSEHPELSNIVLSLVGKDGRAEDGFLRLHEIYNLRLPAEMVVLSACQTALGKEIKGEGLIGLTRGFMYAGAARVVASLWKIDDRATAELMKRFYEGMLGQKRLRPAAALRAAQLEMLRRPRWQNPYYWAAFVLQGEWK
jgi:CHAT domain-containing protein/Tfp pilus assembly protein PilF